MSDADGLLSALVEDDPVELYENAPCAYLSTLPDGTLVKVNQTFLSWTGYDAAAVVRHRRLPELLPAGGRMFYETHLSPLLLMQGAVREIATELECADGSRLPVILNGVLQRDATGEPQVLRFALFDATERRSYERELLEARRRAEASEERARTLAATLQASLLPPALLAIRDLDVAGTYRPAGDGFEVGGDFYDVYETGRGSWAVVLGDVCGKGARAATITSLARYTVRAESLRTPYPSAVLAALHEAMRRYQPDDFCTALFLVLDRYEGSFRLMLSSGGHHLPIRLRDGQVDRIGRPGSILGMLERSVLHDETVLLLPGDLIVLYTDGVTEARRGDDFFEEEALEALVVRAGALGAQELADAIVQEAVGFQSGDTRDDIAVVVLRVPADES